MQEAQDRRKWKMLEEGFIVRKNGSVTSDNGRTDGSRVSFTTDLLGRR